MTLTATKGEFYDSPLFKDIDQTYAGEAGGASGTSYTRFRTFMAVKLLGAHAVVTTATSATGHGFDVYHGTTSVGSIAVGAGATGTGYSWVPSTPRSIAAGEAISVKSLSDATGKADIVFEYKIDPAAQHN